ncbi:MAG TPA: transposase [Candidatus Dormibacteraeota bacterium]|nr:transposase [Candidatus Dormibacteraeota bacterium]
MNADDLNAAIPELERFHQRFFCRTEGRAASRRYLTGLMLPIERKNVENVADQVGVPIRRLQEFLSDSPWDDDGCIDELQRFVGEHLGTRSGVLILDDTGFAKKGTHSAGVGRQHSGTLGRRDNCHVGMFLAHASSHGHTLVDRRLYLLKEWFTKDGAARRRLAGIPEGLVFLYPLGFLDTETIVMIPRALYLQPRTPRLMQAWSSCASRPATPGCSVA